MVHTKWRVLRESRFEVLIAGTKLGHIVLSCSLLTVLSFSIFILKLSYTTTYFSNSCHQIFALKSCYSHIGVLKIHTDVQSVSYKSTQLEYLCIFSLSSHVHLKRLPECTAFEYCKHLSLSTFHLECNSIHDKVHNCMNLPGTN